MTAFEIVGVAHLALVPPALGALFVRRFDRLERRLDDLTERVAGLSERVAGCATREEVSGCATREELAEFRREMRSENAALRSDLTQIALAVGARRPHASEG